ncbi:aldehyde dehydrogenase family protein [Streptomyces griseocarneus]|uniref:aldehyde dehydrogenase family protein n=1 Tax=Streptomyces griseocarneus TaxID=51201 RepID=UPI00167D98CF|nr:aldehyde dehydrogenase family protein [Streptomyces griseocarneus]MBZ6475911.1 aldehyde dehydrogenase family protein [Streptomyces griseocarneus]GHG50064.1 succinic semialdehyde dehydrogenase [Streptomyces griseocarneus]
MPSRPRCRTYQDLLGTTLTAALKAGTVSAGDREHVPVDSAFSGRPLLSLPLSSPADARNSVERARTAQGVWRGVRTVDRIRWLTRLREGLAARHGAFGSVLTHAAGLGAVDAAAELRQADQVLRHVGAAVRHGLAPWHPRGRAGPVGPQSQAGPRPAVLASQVDDARPLASLLEGALPALLRGGAVVTEVDVRSAMVALAVTSAARRAGLPAGAWQLVVQGLADQAAARAVRAVLTEHADDVAPQCCGQGPPRSTRARPRPPGLLVLRHDGQVRAAARAAVRACFSRAGRGCAATPLIAVHTARSADFLDCFVREAARFTPGSTLPQRRQAAWWPEWVDRAIASGAQPLLLGGRAGDRPDGPALPVPRPVILLDGSRWHERPHELPLGPLAVVTRFTWWAQALDLAQHAGPHLSVFTRTRLSQLGPQFAGLPASRIHLNQRPVAGLSRDLY